MRPLGIGILRFLDMFVGGLTILVALMYWFFATDRFWGFPSENALCGFLLTAQGVTGVWLGRALRHRGRVRMPLQVSWAVAGMLLVPFAWRHGASGQDPWHRNELIGMTLHALTLLPLFAQRVRAYLRASRSDA